MERKPTMIKCRFFCVALLGLCGALVGVTLLLYDHARADVLGGPLPAPRMPRDIIALTPVEKLANRPYTPLFKEVYGQNAFQVYTPKQIYELFGQALAAYQSSGEVCAFSSKYDASKYGTPPKNLYTLSASEERGRQLYFGQAQCFQCHSSAAVPAIQAITQGKDTF